MSKYAVPLSGLMFATWAVYLGGLASLQSECADNETTNMFGVSGIDASLPCHKVYRLYWFFMSWELFVVVAIAAAAVTGKLAQMVPAFVGLLAVALMMFIQASNTFLVAQDLPYFDDGTPRNRLRTATAGSIMVALMNGVAMLVLGGGADCCGDQACCGAGPAAAGADKEVADKPVPAQTA